ncbi:maleylpyruvate isomerase family mycothiol-dependent enzyme [Mycolicibacterium sp. P9-64]|nr:maleylpyruvate isomerase family mycothiol-dependent enzyme [Mycolicibacterium sp. P9-64]
MSVNRFDALRRERADVLAACRSFNDSEWHAPSAASGWRVQDVIAHMGSGFHAMFSASVLKVLCSNDIERTNDTLVDQRRGRSPEQTVAEYERWSRRSIRLAQVISRTPVAGIPVPLGELGRFKLSTVLTSAMIFDHHTHLRHDIAPALNMPAPPTDADRMALVIEWMMAVLENQLRAASPPWLDRLLAIELLGIGGGMWVVKPDGTITSGNHGGIARVRASALEFPEWATRRAPWRSRDVTIVGDEEYGIQFLDVLNVV